MIRKALAVILVVAMVSGIMLFRSPVASAGVSFSLTGSATTGWGLTGGTQSIPGPTLTVPVGAYVTVTASASDTNAHTWFLDLNNNGFQDPGEGTLDFKTGAAPFRFAAPAVGSYRYACRYHPTVMYGTFTVTGSVTLKDWPVPNVNGYGLSTTIIVGNSQAKLFNGTQLAGAASTIDVVGSVPLGFSLGTGTKTGPFKAQLDIDAVSANGTTLRTAGNYITVGGRGANLASRYLNPTLPVRQALATDGTGLGIWCAPNNYRRTVNADGSLDDYAFISFNLDSTGRYQTEIAGLSGFSTRTMSQLVALNAPGLLSGTGIVAKLHDNTNDGIFETYQAVCGTGGAALMPSALSVPNLTSVVQTMIIGNSAPKSCGAVTVGAASTIDVVGGIALAESLGRGTVKGLLWAVLDIEVVTNSCTTLTQTGNVIVIGGRGGNLATRLVNPLLPVRQALATDGTGRGIYVTSDGKNYIRQATTLPYLDYGFDSVAVDAANGSRQVREIVGLSGFATQATGQVLADRTIVRRYNGVVVEFVDANGDGVFDSFSAKDNNIPPTTIDYTYDNLFQVPYGEWWSARQFSYGDVVLTGPGDPGVVQGNPNTKWSSDHYPWPGPSGVPNFDCGHGISSVCDAVVYSNYHMGIVGNHVPGYTLAAPVYLPSALELWSHSASIPADVQTSGFPNGGYLQIDLWRQYITTARNTQLGTEGCSVASGQFDGYQDEARYNLTLDAVGLQKVFGIRDVSSLTSIQNFFAAHTDPTGCNNQQTRDMETALQNWYIDIGNNKFDVYNAFEYAWTPLTNINIHLQGTTLLPNGQTGYLVQVTDISWATEVLLQRQHYWGTTSYVAGLTQGAKPAGWLNNELAWSENVHFHAVIQQDPTSAANDSGFTLSQNTFYSTIGGGLTGTVKTGHDEPAWSFEMSGQDYVPKTSTHPNSELSPYYTTSGTPALQMAHVNVGSPWYGVTSAYDYAPSDWNLGPGETLVVRLPSEPIQFYNPLTAGSTNSWVGNKYVPTSIVGATYLAMPGVRNTEPAGLGYFDPGSNVFEVRGPFNVLETSNPILGGKPFFEVGPSL